MAATRRGRPKLTAAGGESFGKRPPTLCVEHLFKRRSALPFDFPLTDANQRALSIAIHQFHGHRIRLEDYVATGHSFSGKLVFESYDHFGLDPDDQITQYGFVDWFTLQHYERFDGNHVPPIALATVEVPISGSF